MGDHQSHPESASGDPYAEVPLPKGDSKAIRLLEISHDTSKDGTGIVACTMRLGTMDETYHALSYMWGCGTDQKVITLNGVSFLVHLNLWDFLERERQNEAQERKKKLLWIDALCIQQDDTLEKNHQVALMGQIYSKASCVLIWLGEVNVTHEISSDVMKHEYWRRAWILQEFVLAREFQIVHAKGILPGNHLQRYPRRFFGEVRLPMGDVWRAREKWHGSQREYMSMIEYRHEKPGCSNPKDRVYSKLALMDPRLNIVADYNKTTEELFKELAYSCIDWGKFRIHKT